MTPVDAIGRTYNRRPAGKPPAPPMGRPGPFPARIGVYQNPGDNKWEYDFVEAEKTAEGYGGWTTLAGGRSGTAYNSIEDMNSDSGVQGNGVDVAHLDTDDYTFAIQKCPAGNVVWMRTVRFMVGEVAKTEYWFSYESGVDGECD